jgi:inorganic pyrophosphatase
MTRLQELKERLFELETTMVNSFAEQKDRNREMFNVCAEIERIENPESYEHNKNHWELHENRF